MGTRWVLGLGAVLLALAAHAAPLHGRVVAVLDGDTLEILVAGRAERIRLAGIDAPEKRQDFGQVAKASLVQLCFGQTASAEVVERDRYGRAIARVMCGGRDVSLAQVERGLAWHYTAYSRDVQLARAQQQAQSQRLGLWSRPDAVAPWEWRRQH